MREQITETIKAIIIVILLLAYHAWAWGFILFKFWTWFVLTAFPELPAITIGDAIGLSIFIAALMNTKLINEPFRPR